ncbi:MAG: IPT/TIG domain-containing protein [Planctomycetes bacterium]|nr:IPT/TIG domain-containing protein [Planctomycetota bacterium]
MTTQTRAGKRSGFVSARTIMTNAATLTVLAWLAGCTGDSNFLNTIADLGRGAVPIPPTMSPASGSTAGGTRVTIRGDGFDPAHVVLFDGQTPTSFTVVNSGLIEVITAPHAAGPVSVILERPNAEPLNVAGQFTYLVPADLETPVAIGQVSPTTGTTLGGTKVTITGSNFKPGSNVLFGGFLGEQTQVVSDQIITSVAPAQAAGRVSLHILTPGFPAATLADAFEYVAPGLIDNGQAPRVVGANSIDNKTVLVTFSKPMGAGADDKSNYNITGSDTAFLVVTGAQLLADKTTVRLTTLTQDFDNYTVHVVGVKDYFGRELATPDGIIAPPAGIDPTRASFRGTAPTQAEIDFDTDGDAFGDWFEMKGWFVTVRLANGTTQTFHVTSDPLAPDTDLDGLDDSVENQFSFDPRTNDTDADHIADDEEFNEWYSDPANQDTDGDGLADPLEIQFFHTSPILADTDGDQWTDSDEILNRNRNPRRSDVPVPQIRVGEISIFLKETYSYTDEHGSTVSDFTAKTTTLSQSTSRTQSTSDTQSSENTDKYSQELGAEFEINPPAKFGGATISAEVGFEQTRQRGYESTVSSESTAASSNDFQESHQFGSTFSENRSFSKTIDDASLSMDVTISNLGDVAFSISDMELAAFVRDPQRREDVPLATLLSEVQLQTGQPQTYNLGPFDSDRGPFIFRDVQLFPNVAEELRKNPRAVAVKIANFNIRDESGRLFAFSSQDVNDRTAGIVIDYGNGDVESLRVATAARLDDLGRSRGITMREALVDILGVNHVANENSPIADADSSAVRNSYGTIVQPDGAEILSRIRGVQTTVGSGPRDRKFWAIVSSVAIPDGVNFNDVVLHAGANYSIQFVSDRDSDGLFSSTEFLYGCSDDDLDGDTDNDGIGDFAEVRTGWVVGIPGNARRVHPDPTRVDSDGDGLSDLQERAYRTDPRHTDTDEDGIRDNLEVAGYELVVFDGDDDPTNNRVDTITPYTDEAIVDGGNGIANTTAAGDDEQVVAPGAAVTPGAPLILPGPNQRLDTTAADDDFRDFSNKIVAGDDGIANTTASGDDVQLVAPGTGGLSPSTPIICAGLNGRVDTPLSPSADDSERAGHEQYFASDPLRRNTDGDALPDGRELFLGSRPNNPTDAGTVVDTDFDGMVDAEEINGWNITVNGATVHVTSDTLNPDTDNDGLPDLMERMFRMNPRQRDTDGDTIADRAELDPDDPRGFFTPGTYDDFNLRCGAAQECNYTRPNNPTGTNPLNADTDSDGRDDYAELYVSWTVRVYGQNDRPVTSSPFSADADTDDLNDGEELTAGTDPNNSDTDGDRARVGGSTANDGYEVHTRGTDPLKPDVTVTFTYQSLTCTGICEPDGQTYGEFYGGALHLTEPSGTSYEMVSAMDCETDLATDEVRDFTDVSRTFTLAIDGSFTVYGDTIYDNDNACSDTIGDDSAGSFSSAFTYQTVTSGTNTFTTGTAGDCGFRISAFVTLQ